MIIILEWELDKLFVNLICVLDTKNYKANTVSEATILPSKILKTLITQQKTLHFCGERT